MADILIKDNDVKFLKLGKAELNAFEAVERILLKIKKHTPAKSFLRDCSEVMLQQFDILKPHLSSLIELNLKPEKQKEEK